ncbi:hypothetical protein M9Y10_017703 [Tritrichomonas musculus]|uniref:Uncharacterized protein n=1 Tax=Tritrichomonas musculus TaxID=1915356 RepID=A0ABR2HVV5_9EUKA
MKLTLFYLELHARQYHVKALNSFGVIYCQGKLVQLDANRGLSYLSRAADLGNIQSLYNLPVFYYQGNIVSRDINRSIYYLSQCLSWNFPNSKLFLGLIYYEDMHDINKAIKYFTLGANQNKTLAKYYLGEIYYFESQFFNTNKAIYYLTDAAASILSAQFWLAIIYSSLNNKSDCNEKFLYYLTLAAKNDEIKAQMMLGWLYYVGINVPRNANKAIDLLSRSSENGHKQADFILGYIYQVENDASKSISHYKEASSFKDQYAKNNLGVIYKDGFGEFGKNIGLSIEYFTDGIRKYNDLLSMYNLANMYLHKELIKNSIDKSIELLQCFQRFL